MQDKQKFYFFLIIIAVFTVSVIVWKRINKPSYLYSKKEIHLDFTNKKSISEEKKQFMDDIVRTSQYANYHIIQEQKRLDKVDKYFRNNSAILSHHKMVLTKLVDKYGVKEKQLPVDSASISILLNELNKRVQIVPVRLALAQAILESAWGSSRFAKEGNAYFGIHCYSAGCGLPFGSDGKKVFVKSYSNIQESVNDYLLFLNSKRGVRKFRNARMVYFNSEQPDLFKLAESLSSYSEIGGQYQRILTDLFQNYIPDSIDDY